MTEDKATIVSYLMTTLQATSYYRDLMSLEYIKSDSGETVVAKFANGTEKEINVNLDSGKAMIEDIMEGLSNGD